LACPPRSVFTVLVVLSGKSTVLYLETTDGVLISCLLRLGLMIVVNLSLLIFCNASAWRSLSPMIGFLQFSPTP